MYRPPAFVEESRDLALKIIRENPLATIITQSPEVEANHAPVLADDSAGQLSLRFHLAARNPQCAHLHAGAPCLLTFLGPNCYISPTWYTQHPSVPTWNYVSVHAHGAARAMSEPELITFLNDLSVLHEARVDGTWQMADLPAGFQAKLLAEIRGFVITISRLEAKTKLSQNRPQDRDRVILALQRSPDTAAQAVARWMLAKENASA